MRSYSWVKNVLEAANAVPRTKARGKHRRKREHRPLRGMPLHQEGSGIDWGSGPFTLNGKFRLASCVSGARRGIARSHDSHVIAFTTLSAMVTLWADQHAKAFPVETRTGISFSAWSNVCMADNVTDGISMLQGRSEIGQHPILRCGKLLIVYALQFHSHREVIAPLSSSPN